MLELMTIIALVLGTGIWIYNLLVRDRNQVRAAWSDIDVQLKRRHDLIPRLVNAVKGYADYEKATLVAVTELRAQSKKTTGLAEKAAIEEAITSGLHKLTVIAEDYPDLKADENFRQLHDELSDTEDKIQYARRFYNGSVRQYNTRLQSFPQLLLARPLNFGAEDYFAIADKGDRQAPTVELD